MRCATCAISSRQTLLDVGAGPGTAAFAAAEAFGTLAAVHLVETNADMRRLGSALLAEAANPALRAASYHGSLAPPPAAAPADLVVASYVAGELAPGEFASFAQALWAATAQALVVIEPGTPAGYGRIMRDTQPLDRRRRPCGGALPA